MARKFFILIWAISFLFHIGHAQDVQNGNTTNWINPLGLYHTEKNNEIPYPVSMPEAVDHETFAEITWGEPSGGIPANFRFDSGVASSQLGFTGEAPRGVIGSCHRVNAELDKIQWYLTNQPLIPTTHVNIFIFDLDEAGQPTTNILYSAFHVPTTVMEWCEHFLTSPVSAPNGFFMALSRSSGSNLALGTSTPSEEWPFQPNTHYYTPDYETTNFIVVMPTVYNVNFMIRAEGFSLGKAAHFGEPKALTNYRVYRLLDGQQNDESLWATLDTNITTLSYTDNGWNTAAEGFYRWAIKAEYTDGVLSTPRFTNLLAKGKEFSYTVNLSANSGDSVVEAIVKLTNQDGDPNHVYTKIATEETVNFQKVWKGTYDISVKLKGFHPYNATVIINEQGLSHHVVLREIIFQVLNPVAEKIDDHVVITWEEPAYKDWLKQCIDDEIAMTVGWSAETGNNMTVAIRFTPSDLENLGVASGFAITKVALGVGTHLDQINTMEIRIWEGGNSVTNPGTLIHQQAITNFASFTEMDMNEVFLTTPIVIDATKELRIGYRLVNRAGFPFGADAGPNVDQKGALFHCPLLNNGQWVDVKAFFQWNFNWSLKAFVSSEDDSEDKILTSNPANEKTKALLGFSVYRLTPQQPEAQWTLLDGNVTELTYSDTDWSTLPIGSYQWAVKANFASGQSNAKLTNLLIRPPLPVYTATFQIFVKDTQEPVADATIVFDGVTLIGYVAENLSSGTYSYTVSKENYSTASGEVTIGNENVIQTVFLTSLNIHDFLFANIQLYPNPFTNEICISQPDLVRSVQITDMLGHQVKNVIYNGKTITAGELSNGIYFVTLESFMGEKLIQKVVKK